jgi:hypothetical protein
MDSVTFDEDDSIVPESPKRRVKKSLFNKIVINMGLAKDEKQAQLVLLGIAVLFLAIAAFNMFAFVFPHS